MHRGVHYVLEGDWSLGDAQACHPGVAAFLCGYRQGHSSQHRPHAKRETCGQHLIVPASPTASWAVNMSSLDIPEPQCLNGFENDNNGIYWHHRVLVVATTVAGIWIAAKPDMGVRRLDLNTQRLVAVARNADFPRAPYGEIYHFDNPISSADLVDIRARAKAMLTILGVQTAAIAPPQVAGAWRIADPSHLGFGDDLLASAVMDVATFVQPPDRGSGTYAVALVLVDDCWTPARPLDTNGLSECCPALARQTATDDR